jgi:hypothetical protein
MLSYLFRVKPFENYKLNFIEIFNECTFLVLNYIVFSFTDYEDPDIRDLYGWAFVGILSFNMIFNLLVTIFEIF